MSIQVRLANKLRLTTARVARYLPESVAKCPELEQVGTHSFFCTLQYLRNLIVYFVLCTIRYMYNCYLSD